MHLQDAIVQIAEIRTRMRQAQTFRGYRSRTVLISAMFAFAAGAVQSIAIPEPQEHVTAFLLLWFSAAITSLLLVANVLHKHSVADPTGSEQQRVRTALTQFLPPLVAGGLLTIVIVAREPTTVWMLPGLWSVLFGLAIFSSLVLLPRLTALVGAYYVFSGILLLALGPGPHALAAWTMLSTFGVGQILAAGILYRTLERPQFVGERNRQHRESVR